MQLHLVCYIFATIQFLQDTTNLRAQLNSLCGGTTAPPTTAVNCETAYAAVDTSCRSSLSNNNLVCTSSCGTVLAAAVAACGSSVSLEFFYPNLFSYYAAICKYIHTYIATCEGGLSFNVTNLKILASYE